MRAIYRFFILGGAANLLFAIVGLVLRTDQVSTGLWPLFFIDLVVDAMENPQEHRKFFYTPINIKNSLYPIALVILVGVWSYY